MNYKSYRYDVTVHSRVPHHITATYAVNDREGRLLVSGVVAGGFNAAPPDDLKGQIADLQPHTYARPTGAP